MISFYFKYNKEHYKALANLTGLNGKVSCDLLSVLSERTDEAAAFDDLETGILRPSKKPLMKAINQGLDTYLKNFPI